jgi:hypothetical protein
MRAIATFSNSVSPHCRHWRTGSALTITIEVSLILKGRSVTRSSIAPPQTRQFALRPLLHARSRPGVRSRADKSSLHEHYRPRGQSPQKHGRTRSRSLGKIETMPRLLTADDIIPLVASLTDTERIRLLRWIASPRGSDASVYAAAPSTIDEFSSDDDSVAWEADGWEEFR